MNAIATNGLRGAKISGSARGGSGLASEGLVLAGIAMATLAVGTALYLQFGFGFTASLAIALILYLGLLVSHALVHRSCAVAKSSQPVTTQSQGRTQRSDERHGVLGGVSTSTEGLSGDRQQVRDTVRPAKAAVSKASFSKSAGTGQFASAPGHDLGSAPAGRASPGAQQPRVASEREPELAFSAPAVESSGPKVLASQAPVRSADPSAGGEAAAGPPPLEREMAGSDDVPGDITPAVAASSASPVASAPVPPPLKPAVHANARGASGGSALPPSGPPREADVAAIEALIKKLADEVNDATTGVEVPKAASSAPLVAAPVSRAPEGPAAKDVGERGRVDAPRSEGELNAPSEPAEPVRKSGPVKIASQRDLVARSAETRPSPDQDVQREDTQHQDTQRPDAKDKDAQHQGAQDKDARLDDASDVLPDREVGAEREGATVDDDNIIRDDGSADDVGTGDDRSAAGNSEAAPETDFITGLGMQDSGAQAGDDDVGGRADEVLSDADFVDKPVSALRDAAEQMRGHDGGSDGASLAGIVGDVTSSGGIAPSAAYAGDRAAYADTQTDASDASAPAAFNDDDSGVFAIVCEALDAGRVDVLLDPILGLDNRRARHFEISLRLRDIDNSVIDAEGFSERLSGSGLGTLLDRATLLRTTTVALQLETRGRRGAVFSKVAAESFGAPEFVGDVFAAFNERAGLSGQLVMTLSQAQVGRLGREEWATLEALRDLGFRFAMSSVTHLDMDFEHLAENGFAYVKFDAEVFLNGLALGEMRIPASDICGHLGPMGLTVIVERIDDEAVLGQISGHGVAFGQGQLFGGARTVKADALRPVSGDAAA